MHLFHCRKKGLTKRQANITVQCFLFRSHHSIIILEKQKQKHKARYPIISNRNAMLLMQGGSCGRAIRLVDLLDGGAVVAASARSGATGSGTGHAAGSTTLSTVDLHHLENC